MAGPAPVNGGARFDDLTYMAGADLRNPLGGLEAEPIYIAETLSTDSSFTMNPGAVLEMGIHNPNAVDRIEAGGQFTAAGSLDITLAEDAPMPEPGDAFDIIDASSITGVFDQIDLPALDSGNVWDLRELYTEGVISVQDGRSLLLDCITCMSGPGQGFATGCESWDLDADDDVDLADFATANVCVMNASGMLMPGCLAD